MDDMTYQDESLDESEASLTPAPVPAPETAPLDRRGFVKLAVTAAAAAASVGTTIGAQTPPPPTTPPPATGGGGGRGGGRGGGAPQPPPIPLENGEPPAEQFMAYPGGTGAYIEKIAKERGYAAFNRVAIKVEPWKGVVPGAEDEIAYLPMHRLAALIQAKKITSVELTRIYLDRMKRLDPTLLCAVTIMEGQAREAAQQADAEIKAGRYRGPLHGIPYGIKDLFATKGVRTTWGSADFENRVIDEDAEIVVRLRDAGAVLMAKLATGLFAQGDGWYRGQTKNPWNPAEGSSGSSAGPGSATAAGCVAFSIGTETQGSIVSPTTRNGISALRPTFGRISRHGGMVLSWSMDKPGPMCRTIEDCAIVFNIIHGADEKDPSTLTTPFQWDRNPKLSTYRIGLDESGVNDQNRAAFTAFKEKLIQLGATFKPMPPRPSGGSNAISVEGAAAFDFYVTPRLAEAAAATAAAVAADSAARARGDTTAATGRGGRGGRGGGGSVGRFTGGRNVTALDYMQSQRRRHLLMRQMAETMKDFDMYISLNGDTGLTNQTGHPAAVFPYNFASRNPTAATPAPAQPIGITVVGNLFADDKILSLAHAYQNATDWHTHHPKLG